MISKKGEHTLCSLSFKTTPDYDENLQTLLSLINDTPNHSIIVAPEVCLTGFDYENFDAVITFTDKANKVLTKASHNKTVILTVIEKVDNKVFNMAKIFHNGKQIHQRAKAKLFPLGYEEKYFSEGKDESVDIVEIDGIKIAILVCFELRFKTLWQEIEGADIVAVPAWWGALRVEHFKTLTQSLAILNQCYVIASDSANEECSKISAIVSPQGKVAYNGEKALLAQTYSPKEVAFMRRYLNVGIL